MRKQQCLPLHEEVVWLLQTLKSRQLGGLLSICVVIRKHNVRMADGILNSVNEILEESWTGHGIKICLEFDE